jgi:hypothetical protein
MRLRPSTYFRLLPACALLTLAVILPAGARTTNFFERFEAGLTNWIIGDADSAGTPAYWGIVDSAFGGEGTHGGGFKAYCAGVGFAGDANAPLYRDSMRAYLTRTVDLAGYTNATLTFWYKTPAIELGYDAANVLVNSTIIWSTDLPQTTWRQVTLSLEAYIGQTNELTFLFTSDGSINYEGWYLDDITLTDEFTPPPPPPNDNFSAAQTVVGSIGSAGGNTRGATAEPGEIDPGNSIWFVWTPYTNGPVTFRTGGSAIDTLLCVYTGSTPASLSRVACNDNGDTNGASLVSFDAVQGATYRLSVRGAGGAGGFVLLSWEQPNGIGPALLPDLFIWANQQNNYLYGWYLDQAEPTQPGRTLMRVSTATPNIGHGPLELRGSSTTPGVYQRIYRADGSWFERYAGTFTFHPGHGHLHFDNWINLHLRTVLANNGVGDIVASGDKTSFAIIDLRSYDPTLPGYPSSGRYSGGLVQGLSVGWADVYSAGLLDQWIDVTDVPSGRYWLEAIVDPANSILEENESNNLARILIDYTQPTRITDAPPNDLFANAIPLNTVNAGAISSNTNATRETGEPANPLNRGGRSVWWRWTAPASMPAVITTDGSALDTILAVYTGADLAHLQLVGADDDGGADGRDSRVTLQAIAQTTYWIAVDGYDGAAGLIQLNVNPAWNDSFSRCVPLTDLAGSVNGSSRGATHEAGEPSHAGIAGASSVWYCWTARVNGPTTFDTIGSSFDTLLGVYTGNAVSALTLVGADNNGGGGTASRVSFTAVSNTTYHIVVDGVSGASGILQLNWLGPSAPRIVVQPASTNTVAGGVVIFSVTAAGTPPLRYQWQHAGTNLIAGPYVQVPQSATTRLLKVLPQDTGIYTVIVSNAYGAVTSAPANLIVVDNPRVVYVPEMQVPIGGVGVIPIDLQAVGDENNFRFSVQFDPAVLSNPQLLPGADLPNATLTLDTNLVADGRVGVSVALPVPATALAGHQREVARLVVNVSATAVDGSTTPIGFSDAPLTRLVGTTNRIPLTTLFAAGLLELHSVALRLIGERLPDGRYHLRLQGLPGRSYAIEASGDMRHWDLLTTVTTDGEGSMEFTDPDSAAAPQRFYRLRLL